MIYKEITFYKYRGQQSEIRNYLKKIFNWSNHYTQQSKLVNCEYYYVLPNRSIFKEGVHIINHNSNLYQMELILSHQTKSPNSFQYNCENTQFDLNPSYFFESLGYRKLREINQQNFSDWFISNKFGVELIVFPQSKYIKIAQKSVIPITKQNSAALYIFEQINRQNQQSYREMNKQMKQDYNLLYQGQFSINYEQMKPPDLK